jgi:pimeloyl-ACP methyl ester carboxylesterase
LLAFTVVVFTVAFGALGIFLARAQAHALVDPVRTRWITPPGAYGLSNVEDVRFTTSDDIGIAAWYVRPRDDGGAAMVFVHGLGSNRGELLDVAALLHERLGVGALLIDLRNHGEIRLPSTFSALVFPVADLL